MQPLSSYKAVEVSRTVIPKNIAAQAAAAERGQCVCVCVWRKWLAGRRTDGQQDGGIRPRQQVPAAAAVHVPLHVGRRHDACCISASQRRSLAHRPRRRPACTPTLMHQP